MEKSQIDNLSDREVLIEADNFLGSDINLNESIAKRFEASLDQLDEIEGGVEELKKELLTAIGRVRVLINEGELSKARTEANCLKVRVSKSTTEILNIIQGE